MTLQELEINPDKLKAYKEKDLVYKDQARKIMCEHLGYVPPLRISVMSEVILRGALKRHEEGETSIESLAKSIEFQIDFVNRLMMERVTTFNC